MSGTPLQPLRVLVVDDCRDTTTSLSLLLNLWGHQVCVAHDGPTALSAARDCRPDVVLLDIDLHDKMDGYEVARQLRTLPGLKHVLLICLTGYGMVADLRRAHEAGIDLHLLKPAEPEEIQRLLAAKQRLARASASMSLFQEGDAAADSSPALRPPPIARLAGMRAGS